jgi:hypothetical protein
MTTDPEPKLAPPGAGLPPLELFIARLLFAWSSHRATRESSNARFERERGAIRALAGRCDAESGARRVLIARLRGIEDSSRYWSVWMTLDHLRIVNENIARIIGSLAVGKVPDGTASTARVKPSPGATAACAAEFEQSCDALQTTVAGIADLKTAARYAHPWFGPLNAAEWHTIAGIHMGLHRAQIERILDVPTPSQT